MKSFDLIKKINEELKKSDEDLKSALINLEKENAKDAQAIKTEIYKYISGQRQDTINSLLDILSDVVKDDDSTKEEHKNNFFRKVGK